MIEAKGLVLDYQRLSSGSRKSGAGFDRALDGLTLSVPKGASLAIVGPSGCGKSSLLYAVAGLVPVSGGSLLVDGLLPGSRSCTAMVFQDYGLFPWKTALQNVELGVRPSTVPGTSRRAAHDKALALLSRFGVEALSDKYPAELSGGERQRTAIARALASEPDLLLLDEPSNSLDALAKESFQRAVLGLCNHVDSPRSLTVVLVTHDIEEAVFLGSSIAVMEKGRIRNLLQNPLFGDPTLRERIDYYEFCMGIRRLLGEVA
ncbi:MAG: ATP-binding cassette domain-containing protein [Spirochaetia bacterium]|nr:ATP-binding cassette domain-containing protein [Spirochaetia bacterium]